MFKNISCNNGLNLIAALFVFNVGQSVILYLPDHAVGPLEQADTEMTDGIKAITPPNNLLRISRRPITSGVTEKGVTDTRHNDAIHRRRE